MTTPSTVTAREYLRVSLDRSGRERSNDEQHDDNHRFRAEIGATLVGAPYRDNGSASRYATKARGDFGQLLTDLSADRFGADLLSMWESSRGSRRVGEWVDLIDLCEERGVRIAVTTHGRIYDPANGRDRRTLLEDAVDSEYESSKISTRAKRATAANAADGKPHGRVPFGYRRRYDPETRKLVAQEPEPDEAPIVVELFERLAAGHSLRAIAADFEARGIRGRPRYDKKADKWLPGVVLSAQTLRSIALRPLYNGQRSHAPGKMSHTERRARSTLTDAKWPALVHRSTFLAVQHRLGDPARKTTRGGSAKHLLSMIARCDVCGGVLIATYRRGPREYACRDKGHVRVDADALDAFAEAEVLDYLSRPEHVDALVADEGDDEALAEVREQLTTIRAEQDELERTAEAGEISPALAGAMERGIDARLAEAQAREDELTTPPVLRGLLEPGEDLAETWHTAPIAVKREALRLLVPAKLGELRVSRSPSPGHRVPVEERVAWWR
jgi:DNA invertase Pin-like site-specific DNA recombinase